MNHTARETLRLIRPAILPEIARLEFEDDATYAKRCAAIRALGPNWQRHPAYSSPSRHSVIEAVWSPARAEFIAEIQRLAAAARAANPTHRAWERVRAIFGEAA